MGVGLPINWPTCGGHQWMSPKGGLPMGLPVGVTSGGLHFLAAGMRCWLFAAYRYKGMRKGSVSHLPGYRTTVSSQLPQRCPRPGDRMLPTCALCWWTQEGVLLLLLLPVLNSLGPAHGRMMLCLPRLVCFSIPCRSSSFPDCGRVAMSHRTTLHARPRA